MKKQKVSTIRETVGKAGGWVLAGIIIFTLLSIQPVSLNAQEKTGKWPRSVLLTNDDGIEETRLHALAKAFSKVSKTYVVASFGDKSGSSNYFSLGKYKRSLFAKRMYESETVIAYGLAGYPAECVYFGLNGLLKDTPPDLVVSGVNGGPNLGDDAWFGSGTIGAARTAAFMGFPAIAVSGLEDDDKEMVEKVTGWVVRFAQSKMVKELKPGEYLTVGIPRVRSSEIKGIKIVSRAPYVGWSHLEKTWERKKDDSDDIEEIWMPRRGRAVEPPPADSDKVWCRKGYIVITPMRVGENDFPRLQKLRAQKSDLPPFR